MNNYPRPYILFGGIPCPAFSHAAGDSYYKHGKFLTPKLAQKSTRHLKKFFRFIDEIEPELWFIENPRGHLRHTMFFIDLLIEYGGMTKQLMYSAYGFNYPKPTNIFTNAYDWQPRKLTKWGKGAKYAADMNNLTLAQRQAYPKQLCEEIAKWCKEYLDLKNSVPTFVPGTKISSF